MEAEVVGVSRSGRVRKKSSKLMDFQSIDELELSKVKKPTPRSLKMSSPSLSDQSSPIKSEFMDTPLDISPEELKGEQMHIDVDDDDDDLMIDSSGSDSDDGSNPLLIDTTVRKSAYMTEKSTKKKIFKDGKVSKYYDCAGEMDFSINYFLFFPPVGSKQTPTKR